MSIVLNTLQSIFPIGIKSDPQINLVALCCTTVLDESSIPRDKTDDKIKKHDLNAFMCPISMEEFDEPVVDKCGHTFNRLHIESYFKIKTADGKTFPCPLDPSTMLKITDIRKNYSLANAITETDDLIMHRTKSMSERLSALEEKVFDMIEKNEEAARTLKAEQDKSELLKRHKKVYKKRAENLRNMSLYDRINAVFFYSYLETVQNRGIEDLELKSLNIRALPKKL